MAGPYDNLVGELAPGQEGWLPLDDAGVPSGPATVNPPLGLGAKAASVTANPKSPVPDNEHALYTTSGAELIPPLTSNVDKRTDPNQGPPIVPAIISLTPNTAPANDPTDIVMVVEGTNFTPNSVIVFNGYDEPTTFISDTQVSTGVKPSLFEVEAECPVEVRGGGGVSNSLPFTFTAPVMRGSRR